ncbi:hypothetical protein [Aeromonas dhakensis]|uniref:hypothetical protein n=1 Tax=Aeromonas dhakensis TaxID=196024 RepID=UPI001BFC414D|nr:hypothetical protein [Aeromonas dhakensis]HDT5886979.1 hypothetical protein [Aeromonas dhakensis]HEB4978914.1 hypothetical protein [Aeromonas dhakensis]
MQFLMKKTALQTGGAHQSSPVVSGSRPTDPQLFSKKAPVSGAFFCARKTFIDVKGNADDDQSTL